MEMLSVPEATLVCVLRELENAVSKMETVFEEWRYGGLAREGQAPMPDGGPVANSIGTIVELRDRVGRFSKQLEQEVYVPVGK